MTTQMETHTLPAYLAANPEDYARLGIVEHKPAQFEDGLRTNGGPGTYEWWYFDAHLDDGSKLVSVRDQAALHGMLNQVFELNLLLIAVNRLEQPTTTAPGSPEQMPVVNALDNSMVVNHR